MADGKKAGLVVGLGAAVGAMFFALKAKAAPSIPPSDIIMSDLIIAPAGVYAGETVGISLMAQNIGGVLGSYEVVCQVLYGEEVVKTMKRTVSLQPGEAKQVSFTWTPTTSVEVARTYQVDCEGLSGSITVHPTPVAVFEVSNLVIEPTEVYVGGTVTISVTVTNTGDVAGSYEVECTVG